MSALKNLIAPFQKALIVKRMCPGCTSSLDKAKQVPFRDKMNMIECSCRRMFVYDKETDTYRRATLRDADMFAKMV